MFFVHRWLPWSALAVVIALYLHQFFLQGGKEYLSPDGEMYLSLIEGEPRPWPKNTRVLQPGLVLAVSQLAGLSPLVGFQVLTPLELLASLGLLWHLLARRGTSALWQAATILVLGCPLAVTFGHAPVLVDPLLLLIVCAMIAVLDRGRLGLALLLVCLAVLTKEYGAVLIVVWAVLAYREGYRKLVLMGLLLPWVEILALIRFAPMPRPGTLPDDSVIVGIEAFVRYSLRSHIGTLKRVGFTRYLKTVYLWLWGLGWPFFVLALGATLRSLRSRQRLDADQLRFFPLLLVSWPLAFLGDSYRALFFLAPFACLAAAAHPLSRHPRFNWLLALGGTATALAWPAYYVVPPPPGFITGMIGLSLTLTGILMGVQLTYWLGTRLHLPWWPSPRGVRAP